MNPVIIFLFAVLSTGCALKCHTCSSKNSWAECGNKTKEITCDATKKQTRCAAANGEFRKNSEKGKFFTRSCLTEADCTHSEKEGGLFPFCQTKRKAGWEVKCKVKCCAKDNCNKNLTSGAVSLLVSGLFILSSPILAMLC